MAEGAGGERTEKATPKRRQDAREKGQVLKSNDVVVGVSLMAMVYALRLVVGYMSGGCKDMLEKYLTGSYMSTDGLLKSTDVTNIFSRVLLDTVKLLAPILAVAVVIGVVSNVIQFGFLFSTKALQPKFSKLNPLTGLKNMFTTRTLVELLKAIGKVAVIIWVVAGEYRESMPAFPTMITAGVEQSVVFGSDIIFGMLLKACLALICIAVVDFVYQYFRYEKDLRMSKYEIKMEYKQMEGDPQIKGKIKQKQREMAMMRMMQEVPKADVVITNPTHFAVALKYDRQSERAPVVVAKGQDYVAARIKEIAKDAGVEMVEDRPLAQSLYKYCEIGTEIPVELYGAVADVLAYVYQIKNQLGDYR